MNIKSIIYQGVFFSFEQINKISPIVLETPIIRPHITFAFFKSKMPIEEREQMIFPQELIGKKVEIKLTHWGISNDRQNAGFKADLPPDLRDYYFGPDVVHITTSVGPDGEAANTKNIEVWEELKAPIYLVGIFDFFKRY